MLDFTPLRQDTMSFAELARTVTYADLHEMTDEMIGTMLDIIHDATDADVVFVPIDPAASDPFGKAEENDLAWTLGHVVLHATASAEEAAAQSSSLARGLVPEGRSRYEADWRTVSTIAQLRNRLYDSRHMRHAFLNAWPEDPHLDTTYTPIPRLGPLDATGRYILGLMHDDAHLAQLQEIMRQARVARNAS